ncbi:MAG: hypothetical protein LBS91_03635, partial [Clostridiales Family XIII bacterium]|nr:hypothetical protein [Clostridiales Family XIII bacterium]
MGNLFRDASKAGSGIRVTVHAPARHCDNGASQISQRFARRPYATLSKIFDFVKVTEGAQRLR